MSRLWPESITAGLFPGHCWVRRGGLDLAPPVALAAAARPDDWLVALDAMLAGLPGAARRGARLHVRASDEVAAFALLPWQEELKTPAEWLGYAHACFERRGIAIDQDWIVRAEFRDHRAAGLAYALRGEWLGALAALVEDRGLRLGTVLPITTSAYLAHRSDRKSPRGAVLLVEAHRATALVYRCTSLVGIDVEPATRDDGTALRRLLLRVGAGHGELSGLDLWSLGVADRERWYDVLAACAPSAQPRFLARDCWS